MLVTSFNPFPNKPLFIPVCSICILKTLWEKEKLLVTSNFSLSHSVFYTYGKLPAIFIKSKIVVCKLFQFGSVCILSFRKGLRKGHCYCRSTIKLYVLLGVLHGLVVRCLTRNPGVLSSSCTGSFGFFLEVSLGKTLQSPSLVLVKPRKDMGNVNFHRDMTEILLKAV